MPLYEYECEKCNHRFERIQKFSDELVSSCPSCDGKVKKLLSSPAIQFKGTGWYVTDYARQPRNKETDSSKTDSSKTDRDKDSSQKESSASEKASSSQKESSTSEKASSSKPEKSSKTDSSSTTK